MLRLGSPPFLSHPFLAPLSQQLSFPTRSSSLATRHSSVLVMYDITSHFVASKSLAEAYVLFGRDIVKACRKNGRIARNVGRTDHEAAWATMAGLLDMFVPLSRNGAEDWSGKRKGHRKDGVRAAISSYTRPDWSGFPSGQEQVEDMCVLFLSFFPVTITLPRYGTECFLQSEVLTQ